ncbi:probable tRNA (uracil-O(2)-)-methyltransferase [Toxorhynchites rutilus septentrionalis]|uniref:probable tRNA (uracil-O(2)-)-methyltransferase n=1 Tax=Toxorhynchites rutilus septentrionalis TaxID=329112 RepID=UPI00247B1D0A|nr:probable tRNA (uracil-O(2)-)-methyltransferase [Toxorhynchites rutilus septentrionalis]
MFDQTLISQNMTDILDEHYFRAVSIYLFKPHVVNRKLFGVDKLLSFAYRKHVDAHSLDTLSFLKKCQARSLEGSSNDEIISSLSDQFHIDIEKTADIILNPQERNHESCEGYIVLNRFLPRNLNVFGTLDVLAVINIESKSSSFICLQVEENNLTPKFPFTIQLTEQTLSIKCNSQETVDEKSTTWLREILFHKLLKWIDNFQQESNTTKSNGELISLNLIKKLEEYNVLYSQLKIKYATEMVKNWPETTDPRKYVYEDVAIATYLLLLWKQERENTGCERRQSFVDVGCGNGLLVYILTSEGHDGMGIDLRKRKIWDIYPQNVKLIEESIVPSESSMFTDIDWVIGNHSDELSPWIPVIAARSTFRCRYFLLPCCAFEFNGSKFQRQNAGVSQYNGFLQYVSQISEVCGFKTTIDRLKIPSTKRRDMHSKLITEFDLFDE